MDYERYTRIAEQEVAAAQKRKKAEEQRSRRVEAARQKALTLEDVEQEPYSAEPPPYLSYAGVKTVSRSASHDHFLHPPVWAIRRRPACKFEASKTLYYAEFASLPQTSHKAHFADRGPAPRLPNCRPPSAPAPFKYVEGAAALMRSTSMDHFQSSHRNMTRTPFVPPTNPAPYSSADAQDGEMGGTTSACHFQHLIMPKRRPPCLPPAESGLPWRSADVRGGPLPRTTSMDHFQSKPYSKRQPCTPINKSKPPY